MGGESALISANGRGGDLEGKGLRGLRAEGKADRFGDKEDGAFVGEGRGVRSALEEEGVRSNPGGREREVVVGVRSKPLSVGVRCRVGRGISDSFFPFSAASASARFLRVTRYLIRLQAFTRVETTLALKREDCFSGGKCSGVGLWRRVNEIYFDMC
jgi:hypothetical protein